MKSVSQILRKKLLRRFSHDRGDILASAVRWLSSFGAPSRRSALWTDAIYGWGNEEWAAEEFYLAEVVHSAESSSGPILECGSGLTTLLMGAVAARSGRQIHTLEHNAEWHARVTEALQNFGITAVTVHLTPLRDFGPYDWYDAPLSSLPHNFSLIVCDGPPASTRGGRGGMLPTMRKHLGVGCTILLDDANRPAEKDLVEGWRHQLDAVAEIRAADRGFARIVVTGSSLQKHPPRH